jgi:hypothetical protein
MIGTKELRELPMMWWAYRLIDGYRQMQSKRKDLRGRVSVCSPKVIKAGKQNENP